MTEVEAGAPTGDGTDASNAVDRLIDRAVIAMNRGDVARARDLARTALATDGTNRDAAELLAEETPFGELRRATLMFTDLVDSTALSERLAPEAYRNVVRRYTRLCREVVERYEGHVSHVAGDGVLAVFGLPAPHENDVERAVRAALDVVAGLIAVSDEIERTVGERLHARAGVHRGLVYLDADDDDVYGLAANIAARLQALAEPDTVLVSADVRAAVGGRFVAEELPPRQLKGVSDPIVAHRVVGGVSELPRMRSEGPLVGRDTELAQLRATWQSVCAEGGPRGVHLLGEAGIGKSRVCASFLDDLDPPPEQRVDLHGSPFHTGAGFHALRSLLSRSDGGDRPPATLDALTDTVVASGLDAGPFVTLLAPLSDIPAEAQPTIGLDGRVLRDAVADAAYRYLAACLGAGPSVLVIEDLHWCDAATVEVVGRVLRESAAPVLVVTTSREPAPAALPGVIELSLGPLGPGDAERLVRALDPESSDEVCARVVARGDGVPLFLEALVNGRAGAEAGGVASGGVARPAPTDAVGAGESVPDALYELLVSRLYSSPAANRIAAAAATVGTVVETDLLARVAAVPRPEVECALDGLTDGGVLVEDVAEGRYRFRHELLREVAYELAPPSRRRDLHGRAAAALQDPAVSGPKVDWAVVAGHYERAGVSGRAVEAYVAAADDVRRLGELAESRRVLDHAVELACRLPEGSARWRAEVALRLRRGFLAVSLEGNASLDAIDDYERCLEIALAAPASDEMLGTLNALFIHYLICGQMDRADQVARMLRDALGNHPDYAPDNTASFGVVRWFTGDFAGAQAQLEEAVAGHVARGTAHHYEGTWFTPTDAWASAHIFLANARFVREAPGVDEQVAAALERCDHAEFPHGPYTAALGRSYAVWMALERGDLAAARATLAEIAAAAQRHGFDQLALVAAMQNAVVDAREARSSGATGDELVPLVGVLDGLIATWQMLRIGVFTPFYLAESAALRSAAGDARGAVDRIDEALSTSAATGMRFYDAELMRLRSWLGAPGASPDPDVVDLRATAPLERALDVARRQGATLFERRITADLAAAGTPA